MQLVDLVRTVISSEGYCDETRGPWVYVLICMQGGVLMLCSRGEVWMHAPDEWISLDRIWSLCVVTPKEARCVLL